MRELVLAGDGADFDEVDEPNTEDDVAGEDDAAEASVSSERSKLCASANCSRDGIDGLVEEAEADDVEEPGTWPEDDDGVRPPPRFLQMVPKRVSERSETKRKKEQALLDVRRHMQRLTKMKKR